ncbi:MAG: hypothetical protein RLY87_2089 [Chloroflexota bacterium]
MVRIRRLLMLVLTAAFFTSCGLFGDDTLHIADVTKDIATYVGKDITVAGAYLSKTGAEPVSIMAAGVSTLDNGLDAQPLGDAIWVDNIAQDVTMNLHRPGDAVYGFVKLTGRIEAGEYGPGGAYKHRIAVTQSEVIEQIKRTEYRISNENLGADKVSLFELYDNGAAHSGKTVTTQGYYFWNSVIYVLAEGIAVEEDGSSPQPIGKIIWMEGFPPDQSAQLTVGPNNSFVWGKVEVTGAFQSGGQFGRDGAYSALFNVTSAKPIK